MNILSKQKLMPRLVLGVVMAMTLVGAAHADPRGGDRDRGYDRDDWRRHEVYAHRHWHGPHGPGPGVIYAPPVVYAPPPPPVEESSGINLIIPFNIR